VELSQRSSPLASNGGSKLREWKGLQYFARKPEKASIGSWIRSTQVCGSSRSFRESGGSNWMPFRVPHASPNVYHASTHPCTRDAPTPVTMSIRLLPPLEGLRLSLHLTTNQVSCTPTMLLGPKQDCALASQPSRQNLSRVQLKHSKFILRESSANDEHDFSRNVLHVVSE
jgi:hypothetical protein